MAENEKHENEKHENEKHVLEIAGRRMTISTLALLLILAGVVAPAVMYSMQLRHPSPEQLLVAICISLFSGVVFLWILDATSVLKFRSEWIAKSVYGAAIASVLGTSVGVYKDAFSERKYEYEGEWHLIIQTIESDQLIADHDIVLHYSSTAGAYWGFSRLLANLPTDSTTYAWAEVTDFLPKDENIEVRLLQTDGAQKVLKIAIVGEREGKLFRSKKTSESKYALKLLRPK
jgi:hypothetical protein